VVMVGLVASG
jgi:hypothetical protein